MKKTKNLEKTIIDLLNKYPKLRDEDRRLIVTIWNREMEKEHGPQWAHNMPLYQFYETFVAGSLTSPDSITRCRRKVQEHNVALRGHTWKERHKKAEKVKENFRGWWEAEQEGFDF